MTKAHWPRQRAILLIRKSERGPALISSHPEPSSHGPQGRAGLLADKRHGRGFSAACAERGRRCSKSRQTPPAPFRLAQLSPDATPCRTKPVRHARDSGRRRRRRGNQPAHDPHRAPARFLRPSGLPTAAIGAEWPRPGTGLGAKPEKRGDRASGQPLRLQALSLVAKPIHMTSSLSKPDRFPSTTTRCPSMPVTF